MPRLSNDERNRAIGLLQANMLLRAVSRALRFNLSNNSWLHAQFHQTGSVTGLPYSGWPRVIQAFRYFETSSLRPWILPANTWNSCTTNKCLHPSCDDCSICDLMRGTLLVALFLHKSKMITWYIPFVVITIRSFPHSWLIIGFLTRVTRRMQHMEPDLLTLPEHMSSSTITRPIAECELGDGSVKGMHVALSSIFTDGVVVSSWHK